MKTIIETNYGFVNATFTAGKRYPLSFSYANDAAQAFTANQASMMFHLLENNCIEVKRAFWVK